MVHSTCLPQIEVVNPSKEFHILYNKIRYRYSNIRQIIQFQHFILCSVYMEVLF